MKNQPDDDDNLADVAAFAAGEMWMAMGTVIQSLEVDEHEYFLRVVMMKSLMKNMLDALVIAGTRLSQ